jgi:O-antigen ligase
VLCHPAHDGLRVIDVMQRVEHQGRIEAAAQVEGVHVAYGELRRALPPFRVASRDRDVCRGDVDPGRPVAGLGEQQARPARSRADVHHGCPGRDLERAKRVVDGGPLQPPDGRPLDSEWLHSLGGGLASERCQRLLGVFDLAELVRLDPCFAHQERKRRTRSAAARRSTLTGSGACDPVYSAAIVEHSAAATDSVTAPRWGAQVLPRRSYRLSPVAVALALSLTVAGALLSSLWPMAAALTAAVGVTLFLCFRAPAYAFLTALVLYSFEGSIKMRLSVEEVPSPLGVGAALLDFAFLASLLALLLQDRGRSLVTVWNAATRWERAAGIAFAAWLCLSVPQILVGGDLVNGLEGFRLTQMYVPAALGGIVVASRLGAARLAPLLLGVVCLATTYAAVRGIIGPSFNEQAFAKLRTFNTAFGDVGRNVGSFTGPVSLVSFLVPVAVACLVIGFLSSTSRRLSWGFFALAMTGIIASYVRTALVAVVAGAVLLAVLLLLGSHAPRRKAYAVGIVILVLGGGYAATLVAAEVSPIARERAKSLADPLDDPSVTARLDTWQESLEKVADEPFGTGVGTVGRATLHNRRATTTDSSYVKILQEQGVPGGALFIVGLAGLFVAAGIRFARMGLANRPLGIAALAGFGGFLVLMLMGEYIEQPGKLLAWTLLGVATWEAFGRNSSEPQRSSPSRLRLRERLSTWRAEAKRLPAPAVALVAACVAVAGLTAVGLTASRETDFQATTTLSLPEAGISNPTNTAIVATQFVRNIFDSPEFQKALVKRIDFLRPEDVSRRLGITSRRIGDEWEFRMTTTGPTARQVRVVARGATPSLAGLGTFHAVAMKENELKQMRQQLADPNLEQGQRQALRRQLRAFDRAPLEPTARPVVQPPTPSKKVVDRLSDAIAGHATPAPDLAWAGLAAMLFAFAGASVCLLAIPNRRGVGNSPAAPS